MARDFNLTWEKKRRRDAAALGQWNSLLYRRFPVLIRESGQKRRNISDLRLLRGEPGDVLATRLDSRSDGAQSLVDVQLGNIDLSFEIKHLYTRGRPT
jgi:hypothetical protein